MNRLAALVDEHRAFATHRLTDQRHGTSGNIERGRVELHELHVGENCAGAGGQCEALAEAAGRVRAVARRARRPRRSRCTTRSPANTTSLSPVRREHAAPRHCPSDRTGAATRATPSRDRDRGVARAACDQRAHDSRRRRVAAGMDDAPARRARLEPQRGARRRRRGRSGRRGAASFSIEPGAARGSKRSTDGGIAEPVARC